MQVMVGYAHLSYGIDVDYGRVERCKSHINDRTSNASHQKVRKVMKVMFVEMLKLSIQRA